MVKRIIIYLLLISALLVWLSWYFSNIFLYMIISLVLATLLRPLTNMVHRVQILNSRIPRVIAIICSFAAVLLVGVAFVLLFIPLFTEQVEILSEIDYNNVIAAIARPLEQVELFLIEHNLTAQDRGFLLDSIRLSMIGLLTEVEVSNLINNLISLTGGVLVGVMAVIFITFFLLLENGLLRRQIISLIPNQYFEMFIAAMYKIEQLLSNYLIGLVLQMAAIFTIASLGLSLFGIKYALTVAVFAAVANLIPYLGPILGASFGVIVGISTSGYLGSMGEMWLIVLKILAVFAVVQVTDNVLLQPLIFSKSVKAHPLEIFVIIFAGATIAGIPGMIAAIPVYTIVRVITVEVYAGIRGYQIFKK